MFLSRPFQQLSCGLSIRGPSVPTMQVNNSLVARALEKWKIKPGGIMRICYHHALFCPQSIERH